MAKKTIVPAEKSGSAILILRGKCVMLEADLAMVFSQTTKRLNERG